MSRHLISLFSPLIRLQPIRDAYSSTLVDLFDRRRPHVIEGSVDDILSESEKILEIMSTDLSGVPLVASLLGAISAQMIAIYKLDEEFLTGSTAGQEAVLLISYLGLISNIIATSLAFLANKDTTRILYQLHRDRVERSREKTSNHASFHERVDAYELKQKYDHLFRRLSATSLTAQSFVLYGVSFTIVSIVTFCWYGPENRLGVATLVTIIVGLWLVGVVAIDILGLVDIAIISNPLNAADLVRSAWRSVGGKRRMSNVA